MRSTLTNLVTALSLVMVLGLGWMGFRSLTPSEAVQANRLAIAMPAIAPGDFRYQADPLATSSWPSELLVIRKLDGQFKVFRVPMLNGQHALPDVHWRKPGWSCAHLEPDFDTATIACRDPAASEWIRSLVWTIDGRFKGGATTMDDMVIATEAGETGKDALLVR